jgi:alkaline phosphatase D
MKLSHLRLNPGVGLESLMRHWIFAAAAMALAGCATPAAPKPTASAAPEVPAIAGLTAAQAAMLTDFPRAPQTPALPQTALRTIVLASCSNEDTWDRPLTIFDKMSARKADLAILMGDNVYGSATPEDPLLSDLRAAYWAQARRRPFTNLVSGTPTLAVWDDHDFGINDGGGETFPQRKLAQEMFDRFWRIGPEDPRSHPDGLFGSWIVGPAGQRVQIITLDTRYWRSPLKPTDQRDAPGKERYIADSDPARTMLGATQWAWLAQELKKPAELRLIVSSTQVVAEGHGWEKWGNFPLEKKKLYDMIRESGAKGVMVVSGDRHYSMIARELPEAVGYPLYDFTASSVNMPWSLHPKDEAIPERVGPSVFAVNYGALAIDWTARTVTMEIRDKDDKLVHTQVVPFAEINAG